ncbi:hypothetical protein VHEMI10646 [[Torrubiella] hemipterigena]|uniref:Aminotransferase class I/classII large domain-containing protein n=1 Tax=[Torrubiella] hemipterigena TaxID=1531966 RepID=A0A0A1TSK7_9HYPO|nr:hypothetical protein VHEMI10646 [[Torrubiella] hemipterigena]
MSSTTTSNMLVSRKPINFLRGWPAPELLPAQLLSSACQRVLSNQAEYTEYLEYGADEGLTRLRSGLAKWLGAHYKVKPDLERICITGGASQNLACILQSFSDVNFTRAVWIVAPCYHLASPIFEDAGFAGRLKAVPEDEEGIDLAVFEEKLKRFEEEDQQGHQEKPFKCFGTDRKLYRHLIYCVPTCSNPSGKTMSLRRREALVKLARKYDALIISDDVYDFLQWPLQGPVSAERLPSMSMPRICDIDLAMGNSENDPLGFGHAVSNGSFSKISGPGVRTGWAEASPAFITGLAHTAATRSGGAPSQLCASMLAELVETGKLQEYIEETLRPAMQRRHRLLIDAVRTHLAPLGVSTRASSMEGSESFGGYFVWLDFPKEFSADLIASVAKEEDNLILGYGNMFVVKGDESGARFNHSIRLCFAWEAEEDLVDGVKRLGLLISRMRKNKEHYLKLAEAGALADMSKDV